MSLVHSGPHQPLLAISSHRLKIPISIYKAIHRPSHSDGSKAPLTHTHTHCSLRSPSTDLTPIPQTQASSSLERDKYGVGNPQAKYIPVLGPSYQRCLRHECQYSRVTDYTATPKLALALLR